MPIIPNRLPRRAVTGVESPPRLRMKRIVAPMYATVARLSVMVRSAGVCSWRSLAEHREHAAGDGEAAEHVDRRERQPEDRQAEDQQVRPAAIVSGERRC